MKWYKKQMDALKKSEKKDTTKTTDTKTGHSFDATKLRGRNMKHQKPGEKRSRDKTDSI